MIPFLLVFGDWALLLLRVILGIVLVAHGWPKVQNLRHTAKSFEQMHFKPGAFWGTFVAFVEFVGGLAIITGFLTQLFALLIFIQFVVILVTVKQKAGLAKLEVDLLILATAAVLTAVGGGAYALESLFGLILY